MLCLRPPDAKSQLIGKDPDAGKDGGQEEKGVKKGEMVARHHRLNGHEFGQALGDGEGQGSLVCCSHGVTKNQRWLSDWTTTTLIRLQNGQLVVCIHCSTPISGLHPCVFSSSWIWEPDFVIFPISAFLLPTHLPNHTSFLCQRVPAPEWNRSFCPSQQNHMPLIMF